jgi:hypothetical protein
VGGGTGRVFGPEFQGDEVRVSEGRAEEIAAFEEPHGWSKTSSQSLAIASWASRLAGSQSLLIAIKILYFALCEIWFIGSKLWAILSNLREATLPAHFIFEKIR